MGTHIPTGRFQRDARQSRMKQQMSTPSPPSPHIVQALKPVGVAAVAVLALYSRQPPSVMTPGFVVKAGGSGLASCSFLPAVLSNGCSPLRAAVTETGSLVIFKGGKEVSFWCLVLGVWCVWCLVMAWTVLIWRWRWCCVVVMNE